MARNYVPLKQVINDFMISLDGNDYAAHASDAAVKNFALRGLRELGFDMLKVIRSLKLSVNTANNTAELPDDYVDWSKVGVVGADGLVYVLGENKNINYSQKYSTSSGSTYDADGDGLLDREDDKTGGSTGGGAVDDGCPSGQCGGHHHIGRPQDCGATSSTKKTFATCQLLCLGVNVPCLHTNFRPEVSHSLQVKVDRASPDDAPSRHGDFRFVKAAHQRPEDTDGTAHLSNEVVVAESLYLFGAHSDCTTADSHIGTERFQYPAHESDIA